MEARRLRIKARKQVNQDKLKRSDSEPKQKFKDLKLQKKRELPKKLRKPGWGLGLMKRLEDSRLFRMQELP